MVIYVSNGRPDGPFCPSIWSRKEVIHVLELRNEKGQGLVEYALILVLVAIVVIAILLLLGPVVGNAFSNIVANL